MNSINGMIAAPNSRTPAALNAGTRCRLPDSCPPSRRRSRAAASPRRAGVERGPGPGPGLGPAQALALRLLEGGGEAAAAAAGGDGVGTGEGAAALDAGPAWEERRLERAWGLAAAAAARSPPAAARRPLSPLPPTPSPGEEEEGEWEGEGGGGWPLASAATERGRVREERGP